MAPAARSSTNARDARDEAPAPETAPTQAPVRKRQPSQARLDKREETRARLIEAAGLVVGRYGYAGASVARITAEAGVAHGAFYLHFKSRQDLFDILLPTLSMDLLNTIAMAIRSAKSTRELERLALAANLDYLDRHPHLWRVMEEAVVFAPRAYRSYFDALAQRYARSLQRTFAGSGATVQDDFDCDVLAAMLIGARAFLVTLMERNKSDKSVRRERLLDLYADFVSAGIEKGLRRR